MELIRIDPISSPNPLITAENFIRYEKLNKVFNEPICNWCCGFACCREKREPNGGFWLSLPTENGSCVWRDCTRSWHVDYDDDNPSLYEFLSKEEAGKRRADREERRRMWSNIRMVRYKCRSNMKLLDITSWEVLKDYVYSYPAHPYYVRNLELNRNHYQKVIDFLKANRFAVDMSIAEDPTGRGINVKFDRKDDKVFSISRSKTSSRMEILASSNYWLNYFNRQIVYYEEMARSDLGIDYDKLRSEGYHGIIFRRFDDDYQDVSGLEENIRKIVNGWIPDTVVVWDYCFTNYEVSFETSD